MLTIRLYPMGRKRKKHYRIVVAQKHKHVTKIYQESLGTYNPYTKEFSLKSPERIKFYLDNGVDLSESVKSLFIKNKIL